jgi:hypothetical protein
LKNAVASAALLADGSQLTTESAADGVTVTVATAAPDKISSTIVLKVKGALNIEPAMLTQNADGSLTLPAAEAITRGDATAAEKKKREELTSSLRPSCLCGVFSSPVCGRSSIRRPGDASDQIRNPIPQARDK